MVEKGARWIRSPLFKKYFATTFGATKIGNLIRIDFGDEKVKLPEGEAYVSDCEIITDIAGLKKLLEVLEEIKKEEEEK
ncbi:MAG: hypothetical protein AB1485_05165 [Candidatus Thermoplasmatota archaeon]